MLDKIRFLLNRVREHLWVKPLFICILSVLGVFVAKIADYYFGTQAFPFINTDTVETMLTILPSSMLAIAVFAVGSMVSAYSDAASTATPRSFPVVVTDDISQNALSAFVGAFIFGVVGLIAVKNSYFEPAGRFVLFVITAAVFFIVILTFLRWVDSIARLGRLNVTIDKVEQVAARALLKRKVMPTLGAKKAPDEMEMDGVDIYTPEVGYVQRIDVAKLQQVAKKYDIEITVMGLPGAFVTSARPIAQLHVQKTEPVDETDTDSIANAFLISDDRKFDEDPRYGLVILSEIASRALSPAVNDPCTAIDITSSQVRLFTMWEHEPSEDEIKYDRIYVPELSMDEMFDDAFNGIARDGAGLIEVAMRLQKAFKTLSSLGNHDIEEAAKEHARLAFKYAEAALPLDEEIEQLRQVTR